MSVKSLLQDGTGTDRMASVTQQNALLVQLVPQTSRGVPVGDLSNLRQLRAPLVNSAGSLSQIVNGSVTPVDFAVSASPGITKWITSFRVVIQGQDTQIATQDFRRYAQTVAPGLTNGIQIEAVQGGITTAIAALPVQKIGDYLNYATSFVSFAAAISATVDYLQFDFALPTPVVLTPGSTDRLVMRIRDNLTTSLAAADSAQYAIATGYQETIL